MTVPAVTDRDRWISRKEAARILNLTENRVSQLTREGVLSCVVTAVGRLYDRNEVEAFRQERDARKQRHGDLAP